MSRKKHEKNIVSRNFLKMHRVKKKSPQKKTKKKMFNLQINKIGQNYNAKSVPTFQIENYVCILRVPNSFVHVKK